MADHPAIVALAKVICESGNVPGFKCSCSHPVDGWCGFNAPTRAHAAYAAVLRDLIASSGNIILGDEIDNVMSELYGDKRKHPLDEWMIGMLRARAREIGVEI